MVLESLKRRAYLGGAVATLTGLAGCNDSGETESNTATATEPATATASDTASPTSEPTDTETDTDTVQSLPAHSHDGPDAGGSSLDPDEFSNALIAEPGAVQTQIDEAAANVEDPKMETELVRLKPGTVYDPGRQLHVKPGVTLDCRGAVFELSGDYDVFFADQATKLLAPRVLVPSGAEYHSTVLTLDAGRTTGVESVSGGNGYSNGQYAYDGIVGTHVEVHDLEFQTPSVPSPESLIADSTAILLKTGTDSEDASEDVPGTDLRYVQFCRFDGRINGFRTGIHLDARGQNWVNGNEFHGTLSNQNLGTQILHTGNAPARSDFYGQLQPSPRTRYGIRNETERGSVAYHGRMWDQFDYRNSTIKGKNVQVHSSPGDVVNTPESAESSVFTLFENRGFVVKNGDQDEFQIQPDDRVVNFWANDRQAWEMDYSGHFEPKESNPSKGSMGLAEFDDPENAPDNTVFWDASESRIRYRTPDGDLQTLVPE